MSLEKSLWQRVRTGIIHLRRCGFGAVGCRIENDAGEGNPDVDICIDGQQLWIELKSHERPKRITTKLRFKVRPSQSIWHRQRCEAGSKHNFILAQVGSGHEAMLYLIPGNRYDEICTDEASLHSMSVLTDATCTISQMLLTAVEGF